MKINLQLLWQSSDITKNTHWCITHCTSFTVCGGSGAAAAGRRELLCTRKSIGLSSAAAADNSRLITSIHTHSNEKFARVGWFGRARKKKSIELLGWKKGSEWAGEEKEENNDKRVSDRRSGKNGNWILIQLKFPSLLLSLLNTHSLQKLVFPVDNSIWT